MSNVKPIDSTLNSVSNYANSILNDVDTLGNVKQMGPKACAKRAAAHDPILAWEAGAGGDGLNLGIGLAKPINK